MEPRLGRPGPGDEELDEDLPRGLGTGARRGVDVEDLGTLEWSLAAPLPCPVTANRRRAPRPWCTAPRHVARMCNDACRWDAGGGCRGGRGDSLRRFAHVAIRVSFFDFMLCLVFLFPLTCVGACHGSSRHRPHYLRRGAHPEHARELCLPGAPAGRPHRGHPAGHPAWPLYPPPLTQACTACRRTVSLAAAHPADARAWGALRPFAPVNIPTVKKSCPSLQLGGN